MVSILGILGGGGSKKEKEIEKQLILLHANKHVTEKKKEKGKCTIQEFL